MSGDDDDGYIDEDMPEPDEIFYPEPDDSDRVEED
jgi:hypothetical protein